MRLLFAALLVLIAAVTLGLLAQRDPGYVLIAAGGWTVESTLSLLVLLLLLTFAALYGGIRLLRGTWGLPRRLGRWRRHRRAARARRLMERGMIALAEGQWSRAERLLTRRAKDSDAPLLNYLGAAQAAQKLGGEGRRDHYLSLALRTTPEAELAVGLTQAKVQLSQGQMEQALATLVHLRAIAPKNAHVLQLLKKLYEKLESWRELAELLPTLRRRHLLEPPEAQRLERHAHGELLQRAIRSGELAALREARRQLPKALRDDPELVAVTARGLADLDAPEEAEPLLREQLKRHWSPALVALYGRLDGGEAESQLATAERWLKQHPHDATLLLTLGHLALRARLWGKARHYLEASLQAEPRPEGYRELGELLLELKEPEAARDCFRKGLLLATGGVPAVAPSYALDHSKASE